MKDIFKKSLGILSTILTLSLSFSCNKIPQETQKGSLSWRFNHNLQTRTIYEVPDTDSFHLQLKDASGVMLYDGLYGSSPESLELDAGSYTVKAYSRTFNSPEFSAPVYGDEQVVVIKAGENTRVSLNCSQLNSGLRLNVSKELFESKPTAFFTVSSDNGSLKYAQGEKRIGFFSPGPVKIVMNEGSSTTDLLTRYLEPCEILSLGLSLPGGDVGGGDDPSKKFAMSISVDTVRYWNQDSYVIGTVGGAGQSKSSAYSVSQVKDHAGEKEVWVCGFIVGGDLSSNKTGIVFEPPFESMTNIAIAARSSVMDKSLCVSVKLPTGAVRDALNLVDNPNLIGSKIYLKGNLISTYYSIPGIETITDFEIVK